MTHSSHNLKSIDFTACYRDVPGNKKEYFVKWVGFSSNQNTWEPEKNLDTVKGLINEYNRSIKAKENHKEKKEVQHSSENEADPGLDSEREINDDSQIEEKKSKVSGKTQISETPKIKLRITGISEYEVGHYIYRVYEEGSHKPKWVKKAYFIPNYLEELCKFYEEKLILKS